MVPALFLAHGSPMIAIEESEYGDFLDGLARTLPQCRAVVLFSAHWESSVQMVSGVENYSTIYDFGGFPDELYAVQYRAHGDIVLCRHIQQLFDEANVFYQVETERGLDHGAWTLLKRLFPDADVPVVEMSVNAALDPVEQFRIGQALSKLRAEDVLIVGSGVTVHNFQLLSRAQDPQIQVAVHAFEDWLQGKLKTWDLEALFAYERQAPNARLAVPARGQEHFAPLFYVMGAAGTAASVQVLHHSWMWNVMSNSAFQFD